MPDPRLGERMCAYVVLHENRSLDLAALVEFLAGKEIAKFKLPERLEIVDSFPVSSFGKVSKKELVERISQKIEAETASS